MTSSRDKISSLWNFNLKRLFLDFQVYVKDRLVCIEIRDRKELSFFALLNQPIMFRALCMSSNYKTWLRD